MYQLDCQNSATDLSVLSHNCIPPGFQNPWDSKFYLYTLTPISTFSIPMSLPTTSIQYLETAYLDTDVGQPEFTPPGFLSLTVVDKLSPGNLFMVLALLTILNLVISSSCFENFSGVLVFVLCNLFSYLSSFFFFIELDLRIPCLNSKDTREVWTIDPCLACY